MRPRIDTHIARLAPYAGGKDANNERCVEESSWEGPDSNKLRRLIDILRRSRFLFVVDEYEGEELWVGLGNPFAAASIRGRTSWEDTDCRVDIY